MKLIAVVNRVRLESIRIVPCKGEGEGEGENGNGFFGCSIDRKLRVRNQGVIFRSAVTVNKKN